MTEKNWRIFLKNLEIFFVKELEKIVGNENPWIDQIGFKNIPIPWPIVVKIY